MAFVSIALLSVCSGEAMAQSLKQIFQPLYLAYAGNRTGSLQTVSRYTVSGLSPDTVYRYSVGYETLNGSGPGGGGFWVINNASGNEGYIAGYAGSGRKGLNGFLVSNDEAFIEAEGYGQFTTDATGSYTGWFAGQASGNAARFTPGRSTRFALNLDDGSGGGKGVILYGETPVTSLGQEPGSAPNQSIAIVGDTMETVPPESIVLLYDAVSGGNLIWGTWVEATNVPPASGPDSALAINTTPGRWAAYVPDSLSNGIRRVEYYSVDGKFLGAATSPDGKWKSISDPAFSAANGDTTFDGGVNEIIGIVAPLP